MNQATLPASTAFICPDWPATCSKLHRKVNSIEQNTSGSEWRGWHPCYGWYRSVCLVVSDGRSPTASIPSCFYSTSTLFCFVESNNSACHIQKQFWVCWCWSWPWRRLRITNATLISTCKQLKRLTQSAEIIARLRVRSASRETHASANISWLAILLAHSLHMASVRQESEHMDIGLP